LPHLRLREGIRRDQRGIAGEIADDRVRLGGLKVAWVAAHLGIDLDWRELDILKGQTRTPDFLALNSRLRPRDASTGAVARPDRDARGGPHHDPIEAV
jgi:hypothetical protein